jgi:hypothetical protein
MKKDKINIFVDDERNPLDVKNLMGKYFVDDWVIVRNYPDFVKLVNANIGNIHIVSFDHDLACIVNGFEKTGKDCADYLIDRYMENDIEFPSWFVHTQNTEGRKNIISKILTYLKVIEEKIPNFKYHSSGIIDNNIC